MKPIYIILTGIGLFFVLFLIVPDNYDEFRDEAKKSICIEELSKIKEGVIIFYRRTEKWPHSIDELVKKDGTKKRIFTRVPMDPWQKKYIIEQTEKEIIIRSEKEAKLRLAFAKKEIEG